MLGNYKGILTLSQVLCKVISCSGREVYDFLSDLNSVCIVDKTVQRAVAACDHQEVIFFHAADKGSVVGDPGYIVVFQLLIQDQLQ